MAQKAIKKKQKSAEISSFEDIDNIDLKIISLKQDFENISNVQISKKLKITRSIVAEKLAKPKVIERIEAPFLEAEKRIKTRLSEMADKALDKLNKNLSSESDTVSQKAIETVFKHLVKDESIIEHKGVKVIFEYEP